MLSNNYTYSRIYKSTNGGLTWIQQYNTNLDIAYLAFFNSNNVIGVIDGYNLVKTNDGGNTWTIVSQPSQGIMTCEIYGDSTTLIGDSFGTISMSKNRGASWLGVTNFGNAVSDISFLNKDTIFATSLNPSFGPQFKRSFNGGISWTDFNLPLAQSIHHVYFKNKNEGYVLGGDDNNKGVIFKTNDLGQSWSIFNTGLNTGVNGGLIDMAFLNDSIALVSGYNGILFKWNTKQTQFVGLKDNSAIINGIKVYPNPIKDKLTIEIENKDMQKLKLSILNTLGQSVNFKQEILNSKTKLDLSDFGSGIYYLKIHDHSIQKVFKIIKE
jgi:hypothetical protein